MPLGLATNLHASMGVACTHAARSASSSAPSSAVPCRRHAAEDGSGEGRAIVKEGVEEEPAAEDLDRSISSNDTAWAARLAQEADSSRGTSRM